MRTRGLICAVTASIVLASCASPANLPDREVATAEVPSAVEDVTDDREPRMPQAARVFDTLWPTDFSREELSDTALAKVNAYIDQRVVRGGPVDVEIVFQDTIDEWHWGWTTDLAKLSLQTFSDYPVPEPLFVIGDHQQFMIDQLEELGRDAHPQGGVCGHVDMGPHVGGCAYKGTTWQSMPLPDEGMFDEIQKNLLAIVPHEYFHLVQDNLDPGPGGQTLPRGDPYYRPAWFVEGTAHFVGLAMINYAGVGSYDDNYPWFAQYAPAGEQGILAEFESPGGYGPYDFGQFATEYIIANVGVEPLMNVWVFLGEGASFEAAFERAVGLSVTDFYATFDVVVANLSEDGIALGE